MPRDGKGDYYAPLNSWNPAVDGNEATAPDWQEQLDDLSNALTQSVSSDGQTPMIGNLNMGNHLINQVSDPVGPQDAATKAYVDASVPTGNFVVEVSATAGMLTPYGTTAQRDAKPQPFEIRGNSDLNNPEWYDGVAKTWVPLGSTNNSYTVNYVIVGAGASGGGSTNMPYSSAGGGGAGALLIGTYTIETDQTYPLVVGVGGAGVSTSVGNDGGQSGGLNQIAPGGGAGGVTNDQSLTNAHSGGCGGGGVLVGSAGAGFAASGGTGTIGKNGGGAGPGSGAYCGGGGGGGMASAGGNSGPANQAPGGNGGDGVQISIAGNLVSFCAGGAGSGSINSSGGNAGKYAGSVGSGSNGVYGGSSGAGQNGQIIIWYDGAQIGSGGVVTSVNGYTVHTFDSSASYIGKAPKTIDIDYLIVAGGGGGGADPYGGGKNGGGGGAGGVLRGSSTLTRNLSYLCAVGAGGSAGTNGTNSSITEVAGFSLTAIGGGHGGNYNQNTAASGGSGGGGGQQQSSAASGTSGQGYSGGGGYLYTGAGGGGAASAGQAGVGDAGGQGGNGGAGIQWYDNQYYGGGGGCGDTSEGRGKGGIGGGGSGRQVGAANTGGGGGGGGNSGANGGSGIIKIRYQGTPQLTCGIISQSGGYTYHSFLTTAILQT